MYKSKTDWLAIRSSLSYKSHYHVDSNILGNLCLRELLARRLLCCGRRRHPRRHDRTAGSVTDLSLTLGPKQNCKRLFQTLHRGDATANVGSGVSVLRLRVLARLVPDFLRPLLAAQAVELNGDLIQPVANKRLQPHHFGFGSLKLGFGCRMLPCVVPGMKRPGKLNRDAIGGS